MAQLPADEEALAFLYDDTIEHHNVYLEKLHNAFNKRCEQIGTEAKKKLSKLNDSQEDEREAILEEEQALLDKTLAELKYAINKSNSNSRKKLEMIQTKLDETALNLEDELSHL